MRDKDGHFIMIKKMIHKEDITLNNTYMLPIYKRENILNARSSEIVVFIEYLLCARY